MTEDIYFDGVKYISATDAASSVGFTRDYVGRLCRLGKIKGKRIGKNWFVDESSLQSFLVSQEYLKSKRLESLAIERTEEYRKALSCNPVVATSSNKENYAHISDRSHDVSSLSGTRPSSVSYGQDATAKPPFDATVYAMPAPIYAMGTIGRKAAILFSVCVLAFGAYAVVDPAGAADALGTVHTEALAMIGIGSGERQTAGIGKVQEGTNKNVQVANVSELAAAGTLSPTELSSIGSIFAGVAHAFNSGINSFLAIVFPGGSQTSSTVALNITPYNPPELSPVVRVVAAAPTIQTVTVNTQQPVEHVITERIVTQSVPYAVPYAVAGGVTEDDLTQQLQALANSLLSRINTLTSANSTAIAQNYNVTAQTNAIDQLADVTIAGSTISGGSISGTSVAATSLSSSGDLSVGGNANVAGDLTVGGSLGIGSLAVTGTSTVSNLAITSLDCSGFGNGGKLTTDASGNVICATDQGGAGTTVAGSNGQVQFNAYGGFAANPSFTFSTTTDTFTVPNASTTNLTVSGSLGIGSLSGLLSASNGTVSASPLLSIALGGTGTTSVPTYGQLLVGNQSGGYNLVSTSSLGISAGGAGTWGSITGTLSNQTDLQNALNAKLNLSDWYATTTNGLTEGSTNLYFTNGRVQSYLDTLGKGYFFSTTSEDYYVSQNNLNGFSTTSASYFLSLNQGNAFSTSSSAYFLGQDQTLAFSTTSASYFVSQANLSGFSTTSASYFLSLNQSNAFSTTSENYYVSQANLGSFSTTSASYFLGQNQNLAFSTTSSNYFLGTQTTDNLAQGSTNRYFSNALAQGAISVSGLPLTYSGGVIGINQANGSTNGFLTSSDWTTFNNKISSTSLSASYPLSYNSSTGVFALGFGTTTANTYAALQTFNGGASTSALTLGTGAGFLQTNAAGLVSATSTIPLSNTFGTLSIGNGGTGSSTLSGILLGNGTGPINSLTIGSGLTLTGSTLSTSGAGITAIGPIGETQTGGTQTLATTTSSFNGLTAGLTIVGSGNTQTFTPTLSGVLGVAGGGTGVSSLTGLITTADLASANISQFTNDAGFVTLANAFSTTSASYFLSLNQGNAFSTTSANVWGLSKGYLTSLAGAASSTLLSDNNTFSGNTKFTNATSTSFFSTTASSTNLFAQNASFGLLNLGIALGIGNGGSNATSYTAGQLLSFNGTSFVSTSTIGNNQLANSSLTVNGTAISLGGSGTITAASSTLLANNNTFSGTNVFSNTITGSISGNAASVTNGVYTTTFNGLADARFITDLAATSSVNSITTLGNLSLPYSQVTGAPTSFASSTLLSDNNTFSGNTKFTNATSTSFAITGLANTLLSVNANGSIVATSTIGNNQLQNSTISGIGLGSNLASLTAGSGLSGTAYNGSGAQTFTLNLANANSWTGLQSFTNASNTLATLGTTWFSGISNAILSTDSNGKVVATSSIGTNYISGVLGTINGTSFSRGGSITVSGASSTLLSDNNTFSGLNLFTASTTIGNGSAGLTVNGQSTTTGTINVLGIGTSTFAGNIGISGNIVPSADNTYSLGLPTNEWKDVYIGPGSLYVNGQEVVHTDVGDDVVVTANSNENLILKSAGSGSLELNSSGTGNIQLASPVQVTGGKNVTTSDASALLIPFGVAAGNITIGGNTIQATNTNGGISITPAGNGGSYFTSGSVGIGTTNPLYKLEVQGQVAAQNFIATSTTASSTFADGINITAGCFSVNGSCLASPLSLLSSANNWSALQTFSAGYIDNASSTHTAFTSFASASSSAFTAGNLFSTNASTTNLTLGTGAGILQTNAAGVVSAGTVNLSSQVSNTLGQANGGTGFNTYTTGAILYADGSGNLQELPAGSNGSVLKIAAGLPSWGVDLTSGSGGGGDGIFGTTSSGIIYPLNTSAPVVIGSNSTSSNNSIFEVSGQSYFSSKVGIGSTTPSTNLSVAGSGYFTGGLGIGALNTAAGTLVVTGNTALANATSSSFAITGLANTLLSTNAIGSVGATVFSGPLSFSGNTLSISQAAGSQSGFLASSDWTNFNNKISSSSLSATYPLAYNSSTGVFSTNFSTTTTNVFSASNTFNGNTIFTNATSTSFFSTNASSTNLFAQAASFGSLTLGSGTTTAGNGVNLTAGCFSINGTCIGSTAASSTLLDNNNTFSGANIFTQTITGSVSGNAGTVTNGVYTTTFNGLFDNRLSASSSISGITTLPNLSLPYSQVTGAPTSLASSTLLSDNNTFSGSNSFSNTITGSISGNAGTATVLQTSRTINGVSFNGSGNITINAASSSLLSDNNTFSGKTIFGAATSSSFAITGLANTLLSVNANGTIIATSTIGNNQLQNSSLTINGTNIALGGSGTITAASSTLLANNNTWTGLQTFGAGFITSASSTNIGAFTVTGALGIGSTLNVTGNSTLANASSTNFTASGEGFFTTASTTNLTLSSAPNAVLSTNSSGQVVATTSIGTNYLTGVLGTINGASFSRGGAITVVAASSSILSDNNTFSGTNTFSNTITGSISGNAGTVTNGVYTTTFNGLADARFITDLAATSSVNSITTLGNLAAVGTLTSGSIASTFGNINIGSNTFTGVGTGLTGTAASLNIGGNAGTATTLQTSRTINGVAFNGSGNITINAASSSLLADNNTFSGTNSFANTTATNATSTSLYSTSLGLGSGNYFTSLLGAGLTNVGGVLTVNTGASFSTTSADYYIESSSTIPNAAGGAFGNLLQWNGSKWISTATSTLGLASLSGSNTFSGNNVFSNTITGSISGNAGTVTTDANLTGAVTSSGNTTSLGSFSSANLSGALTDETGSGAAVFATSPILVTPNLGTPSALVGTNITGTAASFNIGGNAGTVTNGVYTTTFNGLADARFITDLAATSSVNSITTLNNLNTVGTLTSGSIASTFGNINIGSNTFTGVGTGLTGTAASLNIGGNAGTATTLQSSRTINGVSFNGSASITINAASSTLLGDTNTFTATNTFANIINSGLTANTLLYANGSKQESSATVSGPLSFSAGTLSISKANGTTDGYLAQGDWTTFNNKISSTSLSATYPLAYNSSTGNFSLGFGTTTSNTFSALQIFNGGASTTNLSASGSVFAATFNGAGTGLTGTAASLSIGGNANTATTLQTARTINGVSFDGSGNITINAASSTLLANSNTFSGTNSFTGNTTFANATTSNFAISGVTNSILSTNANGSVVATTSIGTNLLTGTLGTINGTPFNAGSSITVGGASTTLLTDNNTFSGNNSFTNQILGTSTAATRLATARTINGVSFDGSGNITINAASSTLLANSNTFSGNNIFSSLITGSVSGNAGTATTLQTARTINGVSFDGSGNITINAASSTLLANSNTFSGNNSFTGQTGLGNASSTNFTASGEGFFATASTTNLILSGLPNAILSTNASGQVVATTTINTNSLGGVLTIAHGGTATSTQFTNGVNYFDGTQITSGANLTFDGSNFVVAGSGTFGSTLAVNIPTGSLNLANLSKTQNSNDSGAYQVFQGGTSGTTVRGYLGFTHTGSGGNTFFTSGELADSIALRSQGGFQLGTGGNNIALTIDTAQQVGIGTTTPGSILSINGVGNFVNGATSTLYKGLNLTSGCFSIGGTCLSLSNLGGTVAIANGGTNATSYTSGQLLSFNGTSFVSTSTIGNNQLANSSLTINGTSIGLGSSGTITAASSTLLANNNTFSGNNIFSSLITGSISGNANTVTNGVYTTTFNNLFDNRLSASSSISGITTLPNLSLPYSQITGAPTTFASSTLLSDNNTFSGANIFTKALNLSATTGTTTIAAGQGFTIGTSQFVLQQGSGSVGIGTASPTSSLDVLPTGGKDVLIGGGSNTGSEVKFTNTGTAHFSIYNSGNNNLTIANTGSLLGTNILGTPLLSISSAGNLGIGTTSPFAKLSVAGSTYIGGNFTATGTVAFTNITNGLLSADASGNVTASTSIGTNLLTGNLATINGTTVANGGTYTIAAASTTLLADSSTFSGIDSFTNASSNFGGTWQTYSPSHFQTALGFTPYNATNPNNYIPLTALSGTYPIIYNSTTGAFSFPATSTLYANLATPAGSFLAVDPTGHLIATTTPSGGGGGSGNVATSSAETATYVPVWSSTNGTPAKLTGGSTALVVSSGDVGIGTASPKSLLETYFTDTTNLWSSINTPPNPYTPLANELSIENQGLNTANSYAGIFFQPGQTSAGTQINAARIGAIRDGSGIQTDLVFGTRNTAGAFNENMRILGNGNIGIGTTTPGTLLSLGTSGNFINLSNTGTSTFAYGIQTSDINEIGSATSTFTNGINISGGCFAINGTCLSLSSFGDVLPIANGGTNATSYTSGQLLSFNGTSFVSTSTIGNNQLQNSTISGVALGGTLANLTATNGSLTFSGAYNGSAAQTVGLNLGNANIWTGLQTFNGGASSTVFSASGTIFANSFTGAGTGLTGTAAGLTAGTVTTNANLTGAITSTGNATLLGSFTSANLLGALTDETGTGSAVFSIAPTFTGTAIFANASTTNVSASGASFFNTINATGNTNLANATSTSLFTTSLGLGSGNYFTSLLGSGLSNVGGVLTVNGGASFSTTSADAYISASTTIPNPAGGAFGNVIQWNGSRWISVSTSSLSITAASSTLLGDNNTFSGSNIFTKALNLSATTGTTTIAAGQGFAIGGSQFVVQQGSGFVGIGTTTPGSILSVQGVANFTAATSTFEGTGGLNLTNGGCYAINGSCLSLSSFSGILPIANGGTNQGSQTTNGVNYFDGTHITSDTGFVYSGGSVGIGTSTPGSILSVQGVANFSAATTTFEGSGGINITSGCFSVNGSCITGGLSYSFSSGVTNTGGTVTNDLSTGVAGGQSVVGGTNAGDSLTLQSNNSGTPGLIYFGAAQQAWYNANQQFFQIESPGLGVSQATTSGIFMQNPTAATAILQQASPSLVLEGQGWGTTAGTSQYTDWQFYNQPVSGTVPSTNLLFQSDVNTTAFTTRMTLTSAGTLEPTNLEVANGALGSTNTTNGNLWVTSALSATHEALPQWAFGTSTSNAAMIRTGFYGSSGTILTIGDNYAAVDFGGTPVTLAASGVQNWLTTAALKPVYVIGAGAAKVWNTATLYIDGASTSTVNGFNYDLYASSTAPSFFGGKVGIGTTSPVVAADVYGDVRVGTSGTNGCIQNYAGTALTGTCSSDERLKNVTNDVTGTLLGISNLTLVNFHWNDIAGTLYHDSEAATNTGFIAQNVQQEFPQLVTVDSNGYDQVDYTDLSLYGIEAVKELNSVFDASNASTTQSSILSYYAGTSTPALTIDALGNLSIGTSTATSTTQQMFCLNGQCITNFPYASPATSTGTTSATLAPDFVSAIKSMLMSWLGDAGNGITDLFAKTITATNVTADSVTANQELCVGTTCVTAAQFQAMVAAYQNGQGGSSSNTAGTGSGEDSSSDATSTPATPPVISVSGNDPATVQVGASYNDLGASITGPQADINLGVNASVDGGATTTLSAIQIDTSVAGTHTITYSATDQNGLIGTATRTVSVVAVDSGSATSTDTTTDSGDATSTTP